MSADVSTSPAAGRLAAGSAPGRWVLEQRQHLTGRLLPLLPAADQHPITTTELGHRLGLDGRERDQRLWPLLDRLAHGGLLQRVRHGRSCSWSPHPLLTDIVTALREGGDKPTSSAGITGRLAEDPAAVAALVWCGLIIEGRSGGQRGARRTGPDPHTASTGPVLRFAAAPPTVRVVALIGSGPGSRTRALVGAGLDALTAAGALRVARSPVIAELGDACPACTRTGAPCCRHRQHGLNPVDAIGRAQLLVAASPTQLGGVSGLLKVCLDQIGPAGLGGIVAVAVAVETSHRHHSRTASALTELLTHAGARLPAAPLVVHGPVDPAPDARQWARTHSTAIRDALTTVARHRRSHPSPDRKKP
ncbi:NAD(P)H-dependent oxidoreductase [Paractinoplanes hotanensis]|uniref:NAD(P)H-dependent oxidoreductase n=1 Tax=Paractinoplanes hotanensis TaxID=2906497 RepID=A0ABT0Y9R5_9ACTN|nr:NAD(P)H-dependent oxidoreductase [Actinoplanes hotanensis]MCM4082217.1 NAD(P)H-dependent oxidoreductase [Actinoplanes hotanensis]